MRIEAPERVNLIRLTLDNFMNYMDDIMKWVNDPEITFYFASMQKEYTRKEEILYYSKLLVDPENIVYSVVNGDGEYLGQVSINKIDWIGETGRLFLVITPEQQGRGYFYSAVKAIEDENFLNVGLNKLWIMIRYGNEMKDKYEKCGFSVEGMLPQEYKVGDTRYDMLRMSLLRTKWEQWWE